MIHLRTFEDDCGDAVEYAWFCCRACYLASFDSPDFASVEEGGAYPCGSESDSADYCATCGDPVGNPLTDVGAAEVMLYVEEILARDASPAFTITPDDLARVDSLQRTYSYLFQTVEVN